MKIDKEVAFKLLQELENEYPKTINTNARLSSIFATNETHSAIDQQKAYIVYLKGEELIQKLEGKVGYTLTSKAINLLTDGIDMETYIKKTIKEK